MLGGIVLTGGASRRFGSDKAVAELAGERLASRAARLLRPVSDCVVEVGPGVTGLPITREDPPGQGPLAATAAGLAWLADHGCAGPTLVLAADLPHVTTDLLRLIAGWPADDDAAVVPVAGGTRQPLCARFPAGTRALADHLLTQGVRSMMALLDQLAVVEITESSWRPAAGTHAFADIDKPSDLEQAQRWEAQRREE